MDQETHAELEAATVTDREMDANWDAFEDRFPQFEVDTTDEQTEDADTAEEVGLAD
ncbi:hypothetical protein [Natrialba sp. PRR66]|uniref:hypothetical protein n=1 Tax=Natrialba sp. PRR66 TaxID=3098146 RepID=UPI002B1D8C52|nr:hypothetical protein [Natrialba sp. PRR66]